MKNLVKQLLAIWRALGLNQRITIAIAAVAVIGGMVGLVAWSHRPQMQLLYGRLTDKDVSEITGLLGEQNIQYELGAGGASIYVPADQVHKIRMDLASKGVPAGDGVGFEIFDRTNFGISDFVQRTNYTRALQGELSRTISQLHGVRSARVMIVMPENRLLFSDAKTKPTASVFVDAGMGALGQEAVNSIRFLVANSVEGLQVDDVAVVDSSGNVLTENMKDDGAFGAASSQMKLRKNIEDYLSNKVETMLDKVLGPGNAVVRVSAEIESDATTKTQETFDPDGQVLRMETTTEDTTSTTENDANGGSGSAGPSVGASSNVPTNGSGTTELTKTGGKSSDQSRKQHTDNYEINKTTLNAVRSPGTVTGISAAVFIAAKSDPRKPEELEALRKMVVNALGVKNDTGDVATRTVTLEEVAFQGQPQVKPSVTDMLVSNSDLLRNAFAIIVAFGVLMVFLGMLKRTKPDNIPIELLKPEAPAPPPAPLISAEVLNDLIRQKPANVGAALRGWMANPNAVSKN